MSNLLSKLDAVRFTTSLQKTRCFDLKKWFPFLSEKFCSVRDFCLYHSLLSVFTYSNLQQIAHLYSIKLDYSHHDNGHFDGSLRILLIIRMWIRCLVIFSDIFCVYLGFAINNRLYHKICNKCQIKCESLCTKYAKGQIQSQLLNH